MKRREKRAVALTYVPGRDYAPRVVAKGSGVMAEQIMELARQHNIPLERDPQLVEVLSALELNRDIPPELYRAVAEVLAYVYALTKKYDIDYTAEEGTGKGHRIIVGE